jgi:excinuclease UvrABC nuclease subunit
MLTQEMVQSLPELPGVYFFKSEDDELLYIGKAKRLRRRVRQYTTSRGHSRRIRELVQRTHRVESRVLGSELEALVTESRLIKEHQPPYNIAQKRLHGRPFLKMMRTERFPRLLVTWRIEHDGCDYFGPFPTRRIAEETVQLVHQIYPLRTCLLDIVPNPRYRPCLDWYIGRCEAPCAAKIDDAEYDALANRVCDFLGGDHETIYNALVAERGNACERLEFERARKVQNRIEALERYRARNRYQVNAVRNSHLVVVCPSSEEDHTEVFFIRSGALRRQVRLSARTRESDLIPLFGEVFMTPETSHPLTLYDVDGMNVLSQWLFHHRDENEIIALDQLTPERCAGALGRLKRLLTTPRQLVFPELAPV